MGKTGSRHLPPGRGKDRAARLRNLRSCPVCGKNCYESRREAKADARRQAGIGGPRLTRAYQCGNYWHLTSQGTAATTRWREARWVRAREG